MTRLNYDAARDAFAEWGVDVDAAMKKLAEIPISMHCWQGDDVIGFEESEGGSAGGIQITGNFPRPRPQRS